MKNVVLMFVLLAVVTFTGIWPASAAAASQVQNADVAIVNINQADSLELQDLPGIGPALAERIIAYRDTHGPFTSVTQLTEVNGLGERKIAKFKDQLVLK